MVRAFVDGGKSDAAKKRQGVVPRNRERRVLNEVVRVQHTHVGVCFTKERRGRGMNEAWCTCMCVCVYVCVCMSMRWPALLPTLTLY